jgi:hypothetical protein
MKVCIKYDKKLLNDEQMEIIKDFMKLLYKIMPLSEELRLFFLDERVGHMTTGSYKYKKHRIKVLVKNRIMSDILRTLSHEWGHAFDREHINFKDRRDVGGDSENFANAISGAITKHYIKKHPELEEVIFE